MPFIIIGNVAGNTLVFAESVMRAGGHNANTWTARLVAIGVATFACGLHAIWRKAGIYLNNAFGAVKVGVLLFLFIAGAVYAGGQLNGDPNTAITNLDIHQSTANASSSVYGYAQAFLAVLFTFGGFHQANYVIGEVENCKRQFKITTLTTVTCISVLYFLVNLSYMFVVTQEQQFDHEKKDTVANSFFRNLFGEENAPQIQYSLLAFSALGNIIVQTFTAARVKQEIAKEGIIPFAGFFAKNYSLTPRWLRSKKNEGSEDTPAGAFLLHWTFAVILILATVPAGEDSYRILVNVYSFIVNAIFGSLVGVSLLILRFKKGSDWSNLSKSNAWVSTITAAIFTIGNLFPLIATWIPPQKSDNFLIVTKSAWFTIPTVATSLMAFAFLWWIALYYIVPLLTGKQLETERECDFIDDHGSWVIWNEVVSIMWKPLRRKET